MQDLFVFLLLVMLFAYTYFIAFGTLYGAKKMKEEKLISQENFVVIFIALSFYLLSGFLGFFISDFSTFFVVNWILIIVYFTLVFSALKYGIKRMKEDGGISTRKVKAVAVCMYVNLVFAALFAIFSLCLFFYHLQ